MATLLDSGEQLVEGGGLIALGGSGLVEGASGMGPNLGRLSTGGTALLTQTSCWLPPLQ